MNNKIFEDLDKIYFHLEEFLNNFNKSEILHNYFISEFKSFFYANLINNFFINLNRANIKAYNLPKDKIGIISSIDITSHLPERVLLIALLINDLLQNRPTQLYVYCQSAKWEVVY